jgi:acyl carrier protein
LSPAQDLASRQVTVEPNQLRRMVIDWLDDNYHFGDAEALIGDDEDKSFLKNGILDSLGFVKLILFLEDACKVEIDRKDLSPANFDSLHKIVTYVSTLGARRPRA